jgi:ATP-dependent Clp protease ATP-binding subunit ClpC
VFARFTERARQVVVLAQDEARAFKHEQIDTEHILLGLLREEEGLAARVLESLDVTIDEVRAQVMRIVGSGDTAPTGQIPFTSRAKKALELSLREALGIGHNYIGTEHLLLGLVRVDGLATQIVVDFDVDAEKIREKMIAMLAAPGRRHEQMPATPQVTTPMTPRSASPLVEIVRELKQAAMESRDFQAAAHWRDVERQLLRGERVSWPAELPKPTLVQRARHKLFLLERRTPWAVPASAGALCVAAGVVLGRLIWG